MEKVLDLVFWLLTVLNFLISQINDVRFIIKLVLPKKMEEQFLRCYHPNKSSKAHRTVQHNVRKGWQGKACWKSLMLTGFDYLIFPPVLSKYNW